MNIQKVLGTGIAGSMIMLAPAALNSCSHTSENSQEQKAELAVNKQEELLSTDSIDLTKPNLPLIREDYIQYRGLDGKVNKIVNSEKTASLYKAIAEMSTDKKPEIADADEFYVAVQKDIQKANECVTVHAYTAQNLDRFRISNYFENLLKRFTAPESEGGSNITVREYTLMMDAFSKAGD